MGFIAPEEIRSSKEMTSKKNGPARGFTGPQGMIALLLLGKGHREVEYEIADRHAKREFARIRVALKPDHSRGFLSRP